VNKIIYLTILLFSLTFSEEIWQKKIPPSLYFEQIVNNEIEAKQSAKKAFKLTALLGLGLVLTTSNKADISDPKNQVGPLLFSLSIAALVYNRITEFVSPVMRIKKKINQIEEVDKKERFTYEALVDLSEKSRKPIERDKNNKKKEDLEKYGSVSTGIQQLLSNFMTNRFKEQNSQYGMTLYEKVLDNYLNQKPLN
jgi:hypothetical protein